MDCSNAELAPLVPSIIGIDFFCGAGGITHGFLSTGIDIICGIDSDATAKTTYESNNIRSCGKPCKFICGDVSLLTTETLENEIGCRANKALVFIGCAPCQPFTGMNTEKANQGNKKSLLLSFLTHIQAFLPEYILMENVPGIRSPKYGDVFEKFTCELKRLGYYMDAGIIDAKKYGVPQTRKRMALIASLLAPIHLPEETHCKGKLDYVVADIAFRFPPIEAGTTHPEVKNHQSASLSDLNMKRISAISRPGGDRTEWSDELQLDCYKGHQGHEDVYGRMALSRPAPTLTTKFHSLSNGRFGHPTENRAISTREGAALQTFPDDYIFHSCFYSNARHIGNAVPVLLAGKLGESIVLHYQKYASQVDSGTLTYPTHNEG